ncbi:hypothetical protein NLG97_g6606 [Lecanicillium saksenae]|uniref:Uncharacterized protein n=1 Tax=Lecanicillium saksenae TaxID=468837 RepID=A0ACC1QP55_9HYPO|nr:hypothetical protein NLG97_g6606 [Lecanicillium saksenae]
MLENEDNVDFFNHTPSCGASRRLKQLPKDSSSPTVFPKFRRHWIASVNALNPYNGRIVAIATFPTMAWDMESVLSHSPGEYSFVVDDLGPHGHVGDATDEPFAGACIVKSKGHVVAAGFHRNEIIESQLLLLSYDRLAQFWVGFGHVGFFERVHVDEFIKT